jgi:hypothetical protein
MARRARPRHRARRTTRRTDRVFRREHEREPSRRTRRGRDPRRRTQRNACESRRHDAPTRHERSRDPRRAERRERRTLPTATGQSGGRADRAEHRHEDTGRVDRFKPAGWQRRTRRAVGIHHMGTTFGGRDALDRVPRQTSPSGRRIPPGRGAERHGQRHPAGGGRVTRDQGRARGREET